MSGKKPRGRRTQARSATEISLRLGGAGAPWQAWNQLEERLGLPALSAERFIAYATLQGYLTPEREPVTGPYHGVEFRRGDRYWRSTRGALATYLAGASAGVPVPPALRALEPTAEVGVEEPPTEKERAEECLRWLRFVQALAPCVGWSDDRRDTLAYHAQVNLATRSDLAHWTLGLVSAPTLSSDLRRRLIRALHLLEGLRPNGLRTTSFAFVEDSPALAAGKRGEPFRLVSAGE